MRHERLLDKGSYDRVDVAKVLHRGAPASGNKDGSKTYGPAGTFMPTPAVPDLPASVGGMIVAAYAALIGAFALATVGSAESVFVITISALFAVAYFTVPRIFFEVEPKSAPRPGFDHFMREGLQTLTGHSTGKDALIQMLIVPVLLTFAALAMGVAGAVFM